LLFHNPDTQSSVWAIYEERIVKAGWVQGIGSGPVWWRFSSPSVSVGASPSLDVDWLRTGGGFSEPEEEGGHAHSLRPQCCEFRADKTKDTQPSIRDRAAWPARGERDQGVASQETYTTERPIHPDEAWRQWVSPAPGPDRGRSGVVLSIQAA
jgi:hypothetical protein